MTLYCPFPTANKTGLVRHILRSGTYTQCLLQADRIDSEAKGSTFASAFKRVILLCKVLLRLVYGIGPSEKLLEEAASSSFE